MKKFLSIILSVVISCSVFSGLSVFASENLANLADGKAMAFKDYATENGYEFNENYFFLGEFTADNAVDNNFKYVISSNYSSDLNVCVGLYDDEMKKLNGANLNSEDTEVKDWTTLTIPANGSIEITTLSNAKKVLPLYFALALQNPLEITSEVTFTVSLKEVTIRELDEEPYLEFIEGVEFATLSHTFKKPINIGGLNDFSKVLTNIQFGKPIEASDVVAALQESTDATDRSELNEALNDSNMVILRKALTDVYTNISVENVDGIEMPYAALAAVPGVTSTVYTPVLEEKGSTSDAQNSTKTYNYDIKLKASIDGLEANALASLAVKQKVVLTLPTDLNSGEAITVKHGEEKLESTVANGAVSFFTNSFSEFSVTGTVVDDSDDTSRTKVVGYEITQDSDNPNKFILSIVPQDNGQIVRFANAPMKFTFNTNHNDIADGEAMDTFSYEIVEADGIDIELREDIAGDKATSTAGIISFVAKAADDENLLTAGVGQSIKIAEITIKGNGKFWVKSTSIDDSDMKMYAETVEDNQVEVATVIEKTSAVFDIPEKKLALTFKVDFGKNVIVSEDADYIGMTIAIKGINSDKEYTAKVGTISDEDAAAGVVGLTLTSADTATALGSIELPANDRYEFEVSGVGYRTFRGNVLLDTPKTVNLWTYAETAYNANGEEVPFDKAVIEGEDTIMKDVTFLVGDIYMDNIVDIYDISAVLSYYGTKDIQVGDKYIAQDLNRDGKINSMDLALVQVSYGN